VLAAEATRDLPHQVGWEAEGLQGLVQGLRSPLRLASVARKAFMRL
jgi:hypothetical protein